MFAKFAGYTTTPVITGQEGTCSSQITIFAYFGCAKKGHVISIVTRGCGAMGATMYTLNGHDLEIFKISSFKACAYFTTHSLIKGRRPIICFLVRGGAH